MPNSQITQTRSTPPAPDQFEISIFGPGKGEALLIHLGNGDWLTVDSCEDQLNSRHPVLDYLDECSVDPATAIRVVVATHSHDDHVAGISELYAAAETATFVSSAALEATEFFALLEVDADIERRLRKSVRAEYRAVMAEVRARYRATKGRALRYGLEGRVLWSRPAGEQMPRAQVLALSPSDHAILRSKEALAKGLAKADDRVRLSRYDPNEMSVALWVEVGDQCALLGADLERGPLGCGWTAVLDSHAPATKASVFKVPHHGSANAHHPDVWTDLVADGVLSLVAPYRRGDVDLPTPSDVKRISGLSGAAYITAGTKGPTASRDVKSIRQSLQGVATNVRDPFGSVGQVRARWDASTGEWRCEAFWPGERLTA